MISAGRAEKTPSSEIMDRLFCKNKIEWWRDTMKKEGFLWL
ncbi:hypothetical protein HMPREF1985_00098 [Mitsuokella sp. oral taxon 131 str. W9106]|nr:hypothetical protein HMPREF1985_00098 [Mitsuokella sp. oral taxon 131 str. W9106]